MTFPRCAARSLVRVALLAVLVLAAPSLLPASAAAPAPADQGADFLEAAPPPGGGGYQKQALLTILYDGNSQGELHPCPT